MSRKTTLRVSELYSSIQGEGVTVGVPAIFLRLQGCPLRCEWCDTKDVWKVGTAMKIEDIIDAVHEFSPKPKTLVVTGGSPLMQQTNLAILLVILYSQFRIEVENECVLLPDSSITYNIDQWNNSPKLSNSGVPRTQRYKREVLRRMSQLHNSWFKFVVDCEEDWEEIQMDFLDPGLIRKDQVILMPQAQSREEILKTQYIVAKMALQKGVRYSPREHINIWDRRTGV